MSNYPKYTCNLNQTDCLGFKQGECRTIENCAGKTEIILSEQKEPATDNNVVTIGDKIRESNESLAEFINEVLYYCIYKSKYKSNCGECRLFEVCRKAEGSDAGWYLDYLNQPYKD